ncbi:MAG: hypothetical protein IJ523_10730 [Succinivibrionaceae bacterium]|nr:hypothetical protein [Succinivibrionaceae bacterium]
MNTQTMLTRVNACLAVSECGTAAALELVKLRDELESDLRLEAAASASKSTLNATRTIKAMLDGMKKHDARTSLHYAWTDEQGRQCVCDGYRAYRLTEHLPLEPRPENAGKPIDLGKIVPDISSGVYAAVPLPSISELRAYITVERAKIAHIPAKRRPGIYYDLGDGAPIVNAQYLLDLLAVFPDAAVIFYNIMSTKRHAPLVVRTERGDGVLLPCHIPEKELQLSEHVTEAGMRIKDYPLPDGIPPIEYAKDTLRGSADNAVSPDEFAACLDLIAVA